MALNYYNGNLWSYEYVMCEAFSFKS
uniref:Uncharacterized protein n=1 Tax=Arundo donax TaxID=35708 RepID=A0A0A8ZNH6_ARUDO